MSKETQMSKALELTLLKVGTYFIIGLAVVLFLISYLTGLAVGGP